MLTELLTWSYAVAWVVTLLVHELGHYVVARLFGVRVERMFLFFDANDRALVAYDSGRTVYGIGWLPLGGYVLLAGMGHNRRWHLPPLPPKPGEIQACSPWQRAVIFAAGVITNAVVAGVVWAYGPPDLMPLVHVCAAVAVFNSLPFAGMDGRLVIDELPWASWVRRLVAAGWCLVLLRFAYLLLAAWL